MATDPHINDPLGGLLTTLEMLKLVSDGKVQITPQVMVSGNGGVNEALSGTMLNAMMQNQAAPAPAAVKGK